MNFQFAGFGIDSLQIDDPDTNNRKGNTCNNALERQVSFPAFPLTDPNFQSDRASGDGRHDGNVITFLQRGRFFVQVANIFVVYIEVDKGAKFALLGVKVLAQVGMLHHQRVHRFADC